MVAMQHRNMLVVMIYSVPQATDVTQPVCPAPAPLKGRFESAPQIEDHSKIDLVGGWLVEG
jgi:hypothetical protein